MKHHHHHPHDSAHTGTDDRTCAAEAGRNAHASEPDHGHHHHGHHHHGHHHHGHHHHPKGRHFELALSVSCGLLTAAAWGLEAAAIPAAVYIPMYLAAFAAGSYFSIGHAWDSLRHRRLDIDLLMLVAAAGSAALGEWHDGGLLLFLFSMGHALESLAMGRARRAIEGLKGLVPETAVRIEPDGSTHEVPVGALRAGERIRVAPNSRFAVDGVLRHGEGGVNETPITGESIPVEKEPLPPELEAARAPRSSRVFAGSVNGTHALDVEVTRSGDETTLARIVRMVAEAESQKSSTQRFAERFERRYVPIVLAFTALLLMAGFVIDEPFARTFERAMTVLVGASPCAIAISTPSAVLAAIARGARGGVLFKGGAHVEMLANIDTFAFDKTGTLTAGRPHLVDVVAAPGVDAADLLRVATTVEAQSDHPLAQAVVDGAQQRGIHPAGEVRHLESLTGRGVRAHLDGQLVEIGKPSLFDGRLPEAVAATLDSLRAQGRTVMAVARDGGVIGALGLMDTPRPDAPGLVASLRTLGARRMVLLSGDAQPVASAVAAEVGLDRGVGDLLPESKVEIIAAMTAEGARVAMVGDGVNDAPALARANVGIAMGAGGSDVALESADVALMTNDLSRLAFAVTLARRARTIVRQNLAISLGMVAVLIPLTLAGAVGIGWAVVLHEGSTIVVVLNALRLLGVRDPWRAGTTGAPAA